MSGGWKLVAVPSPTTFSDLCAAKSIPYSHGCGFYELKAKETVSMAKELVACNEDTGAVIAGKAVVRKTLKLGDYTALSAAMVPKPWTLYVNSTSANRKLKAKVTALIRVGDAPLEGVVEDGDASPKAAAKPRTKATSKKASPKRGRNDDDDEEGAPGSRGGGKPKGGASIIRPTRLPDNMAITESFLGDGLPDVVAADGTAASWMIHCCDTEVEEYGVMDHIPAWRELMLREIAAAGFPAAPQVSFEVGTTKTAVWSGMKQPNTFMKMCIAPGDDIYCATLQTETQAMIVCCCGSHPALSCTVCSFANSDGSTGASEAHFASPAAAVETAVRYLSCQIH